MFRHLRLFLSHLLSRGRALQTIVPCAALLLLAGCQSGIQSGSGDSSAAEMVSLQVAAQLPQTSQTLLASLADGPLPRPSLAGGTVDDVLSLYVEVRDAVSDTPLVGQTQLSESPDNVFTGTLGSLPVGLSLAFIAYAYDTADNTGTVLFTGTQTQTLSASGPNDVTILLGSVDGGVQPQYPTVSVSMPADVAVSDAINIQFTVSHSANVDYTIGLNPTSPTGGTLGGPTTGSDHDPADPILISYTAPGSAGLVEISITMNEVGDTTNSVTYTFPISVGSVTDGDVSTIFGPAIAGLNFLRTQTALEIGVVLDGGSGTPPYTYAWSGTGSFAGFSSTTNPATIDGYTDGAAGAVTVAVTDSKGIQAALTRDIAAGDFPFDTTDPGAAPKLADQLLLYDRFSGTSVDGMKWDLGEGERKIEAGKLVLSARAESLAKQAHTRRGWSSTAVPLGSAVRNLRADVALTAATLSAAQAEAVVRLQILPKGSLGDLAGYWAIDARIRRQNGGTPILVGTLLNCLDRECVSFGSGPPVLSDTFPQGQNVNLGDVVTLAVEVDDTVDNEKLIITFDPDGVNQQREYDIRAEVDSGAIDLATMDVRPVLRSRVVNFVSTSLPLGGAGSVSAQFDNVWVNGALVDDFDTVGSTAGVLDPTLWEQQESSRDLSDGRLEISQTQAEQDGANELPLFDPNGIQAMAADVTVTAYDGASLGSGSARARLGGVFLNTGAAGDGNGGLNGEVLAEISMTDTTVSYSIDVCTSHDCSTMTNIDGNPMGTIQAGVTHTLYIAFDAAADIFTFQLDANSSVDVDITPFVGSDLPPKILSGSRRMGSMLGLSTGESGSISATFDNVRVGGNVQALAERLPVWDDFDVLTELTPSWRWQDDNGGAPAEVATRIEPIDVFSSQGLALDVQSSPDNGGWTHIELIPAPTWQGMSIDTAFKNHTGGSFDITLAGDYYFDGAGIIIAEISRDTANQVQYLLERCTDLDTEVCATLASGTVGSATSVGTVHNLEIDWDGATTFAFLLDGSGPSVDAGSLGDPAPFVGYAASGGFFTKRELHVSGNDPNVAGDAVQAVFDNLLVDQDANGTSDLYDDFSASRLDLAKYYATGETVLVENQELSLAIGRNGFWDSRVVRLGNASVSRALAADIRVDEVATINGGVGRIGLIGTFFSGGGGTPGDATGDGLAIVGLDGTRAYAAVIRCLTSSCDDDVILMPFTTLGPAAVGETHTLFVEFDGSVLTMQLDDNVPLVFDPAGAGISNPQPPNAAFKGIEVAADNQAAGDGAFIRGAVDNVRTW